MKNNILTFAVLTLIITTFSGCAIIGGIFKTGMGVGIFISVLVVALIIYLITRIGKKRT